MVIVNELFHTDTEFIRKNLHKIYMKNNKEVSLSMDKNSTAISTSPKFENKFCDTLQNHLFMSNVIRKECNNLNKLNSEDDNGTFRKSLEQISNDIKELEKFITVTEDILRKEKERDEELYYRERKRKSEKNCKSDSNLVNIDDNNIMNSKCYIKSPILKTRNKSLIYKMGTTNKRKNKVYNNIKTNNNNINNNNNNNNLISNNNNPRNNNNNSNNNKNRSRLYFRNGKIGCVEADEFSSNIKSTHDMVKHIINKSENSLVQSDVISTALDELENADNVELMNKEDQKTDQVINNEIIDNSQLLSPEGTTREFEVYPLDNEIKIQVESFELDKQSSVNQDIHYLNAVTPESEDEKFILHRFRHLANRFASRAIKMKQRIELPPTPSSSSSLITPPTSNKRNAFSQLDATVPNLPENLRKSPGRRYFFCPTFCGGGKRDQVLDPQGRFYISWLFIVSLSFLYNAWVIPLRYAFPFQTPENTYIWISIDICADIIYLLDVVFVKHRIIYLFEGFWIRDKNLTRRNYIQKFQFKMDVLSLLPLEFLYFKYGTNAVYLRIPRLLKIQSFWEFFKLMDRVISSPYMVRVIKTLTYMLFMIHLTACSYYAYSVYEGLGSNRWVFSGKGNPYVRCFSFATKTATSIGKNPKPENDGELLFMTAAWLMGVFVFALLIGQIRDIISTATRSHSEYKQLVDETLEYMRNLCLPTDLQRRVKMWFNFTWDQQRSLEETHILDSLPANLKTDIAISVHIQTLSKVQLFADCEELLLRELVLKLQSVTFLPGDYVCRKGEVGKEMYIVKSGQVQVMGGPKNDEILATLSEGSVFGEISLLAINGAEGNRRTADVRSKGFSNLFVLSKSDLNEAIAYYPNAQAVLKKRAKSLMRKNAAREKEEALRSGSGLNDSVDVVISNPKSPDTPPKLLQTVIQALPEESPAVKLLTQGSRRDRNRKNKDRAPDIIQEVFELTSTSMNRNLLRKDELSSELLLSIQNELANSYKNLNLTDAEKSLLLSSNESITNLHIISSNLKECDVTVHNEMS